MELMGVKKTITKDKTSTKTPKKQSAESATAFIALIGKLADQTKIIGDCRVEVADFLAGKKTVHGHMKSLSRPKS